MTDNRTISERLAALGITHHRVNEHGDHALHGPDGAHIGDFDAKGAAEELSKANPFQLVKGA
jgi:hypothetical protein